MSLYPPESSCRRRPGPQAAAAAGLAGAALLLAAAAPALAGPVLCTTSLEAPPISTGSLETAAPVEVTRCGVVRTVPELMRRRYFSWRAPYSRGISLTHQITDFFGIAMGGGDGNKVMGFGFVDQASAWDGDAVENTTNYLLENQSDPMPLRTADLPTLFNTSLIGEGAAAPAPVGEAYPPFTGDLPPSVRGLW